MKVLQPNDLFAQFKERDRRLERLERAIFQTGAPDGGWTADEIADGAINGDHIAANSITSDHILANTIQAGDILANTITAGLIAAHAITANEIAADTITAGEIAANAITTNELAANSVTANDILANTITATQIAADTITANNIAANSITASELAADSITAGDILAGTITATQIATGTITATNIVAGTITATQIAADTITAGNIAANAITASELAANSITAGDILANTITAAQIAATTITASQIAADTITAGQIAANAITADEIAANSITADELAAGSITAEDILANTITATQIAADTITANNIAANAITTSELAADSVTAGDILALTITAGLIAADSITAGQLAANSITASELAANSITAADILAGTITAAEIQADSITAGQIAANAITASELAANSITAGDILANTITAGQIAATTITAAQIAATTITAGQIAADTITAGQIAANAITTSELAADSVTANDILALTITAAQVAANTITASQIATNTITASQIAADTITAAQINANAITASELAANSITAADMLANTITAGQIAATTITAAQIAANTITAGQITADTISATEIAANAITASELAANSITAADILANTITATQIAATTITASQISADTITASQIAADAITTSELAANSVTASELAAGSVTAADILAGTITSTEIFANTITAADIAAGTITATEISTGTITATQIAANTITASQIASGTITATQIAANSITASQIAGDTITANEIATGAITANEIAAGAVTATSLNITIGGGNLLGNSGPSDVDGIGGWTGWNGTLALVTSPVKTANRALSLTVTNTAAPQFYTNAKRAPVEPGVTYTFSVWVRSATVARNMQVISRFHDAAGVLLAAASPNTWNYLQGPSTPTSTTAWTRLTVTGVAPPNAASTGFDVQINGSTVGEVFYMTMAQVEEGNVATQWKARADEIPAGTIQANHIVTGTITSTQIATDTITANQIAADAITASEIAADAVTASEIQADAVTASEIAAITITAAEIAASTITGDRIAATTIAAANIIANTITASQIAANTITAGQIAANTLTANEIAANAITASEINAGAVTASKLLVTIGGDNLLTNSSFEDALDPDKGWALYNNGLSPAPSFTVGTSVGAKNGSKVAVLTNSTDTTGDMGVVTPLADRPGITAGQTYTFSAWFNPQAASAQVGVTVHWYDSGGTIITGTGSGYATAPSGSWTRRQHTLTAPAGAVKASCYAVVNSPTSGLVVYVDALQLEEGDVATSYKPNASEILPGTIYSDAIIAGSIQGDRIATNTLTANQIAADAITASELAADSVTASEIQADAVTASEIAATTITAAEIAASTITGAQIAATTITASNIVTGTITATQIAASTITGGLIAGTTITGSNLVANTITATQIATDTITATEIAANSITASELAANSITAADILAGTITATEIAATTITGAKIAATTIAAGNIVSGTITTTQIAADTISAGNIAADAITASELAANSVTASELSANSVTAADILAGTITATEIAATTITAAKIAVGTITATELAADSVTASEIAADAVTASEIQADAVTASEIAALTVTAAEIAAGTITANEIAATTITGAKIAAGTITATNIQALTITGALLAADTITGDKIVTDAITASKINVSNLAAISADLGAINAGTITGATVQSAGPGVARWVGDATGITLYNSAGTVTFKADTSTGKITTLAGIGGPNLVRNSSGESVSGGVPANWSAGFQATVASVASPTYHGAQAIRLTCTVGASSMNLQTPSFPVQEGTNYAISAYFRAATVGRACSIGMAWYVGGVWSYVSAPGSVVNTTTGWVRHSGTVTAPAGATLATVFPGIGNAAVGEQHYIDAVQAEEGTLATAYGPKPDEILPDTVTGTEIAQNTVTGGTTGNIALNTIIAGNIVTNTLTANEIAADAITSVEIAALTIEAGDIKAGAVTAAAIFAGSITTTEIATDTITAGNLAANSITASELSANSITAADILAGTITATEIATDAVTADEIQANAITASELAANSVTAADMLANTITAGQIAGITITATQIAADTITAGQLAAESVGASEIIALSITAAEIAADTITAGQINANAITASELAANSVTAADMLANTITASQIAGITITATQIAADTITAGQLAAESVGASEIIANSITAAEIFASTITSTEIAALTIVAGDIAAGTITAAQMTAGTITAASAIIADGAITSAKIADANITSAKIADANITSAKIADANITSAKIADANITSAKIGDGQITTAKIGDLQVTAAEIADATITTAKIGLLQVTNAQMADATITTAKIGNAQVDNAKIANVDAAKITTGFIDAARIQAGTITASMLNVIAGGGNLLTNTQGFAPTATGNWQLSGSTIANTLAENRSGPGAFSVTSTGVSGTNAYIWGGGNVAHANVIPVTVGDWITVSGYAKSTLARQTSARIRFYTAAGVQVGADVVGTYVTTSTSWQRLTATGQVPATAAFASPLFMFVTAGPAGEVVYYTDLQMENGQVPSAYTPKTTELLPGTISAAHMVTGTITAASGILADAVITTAKIADANITTAKIADVQITNAKIADATIQSAKIGLAEIKTANIEDLAVANAKIAALAVTNAKIADATIENAKINTLDAAKITTGYINAARIQAGTITASMLNVTMGGGNLLGNSGPTDVDGTTGWWAQNATVASGTAQLKASERSIAATVTTAGIVDICNSTSAIHRAPVEPGKTYTVSAWVRSSVARNIQVYSRFWGASAEMASPFWYAIGPGVGATSSTTGWTRVVSTGVAPAGAVSCGILVRVNAAGLGETHYVTMAQIEEGDVPTAWGRRNDDIPAGTIVAANMVTGTITAASGILADAVITTAKIADLNVNAAKIADLTITTGKIGDAQINTAKIADLNVTQGKIALLAVGTAQIADLGVTNAKIGALQVDNAKIADATIQTAKIADLQITNAKIANSTIDNAKIANLDATKINAGTLDAARIGANSITAGKLNVIVGGGNLQSDSSFETADMARWTPSVCTLTSVTTPVKNGGKAIRMNCTGSGAYFEPAVANRDAVIEVGKTYTASAWFRAGTTARNAQVFIRYYDSFKAYLGQTASTATAIATTAWTRLFVSMVAPPGAVYATVLPNWTNSANAEVHYVDDMQLEEGDLPTAYAPKADEILPGTITAVMVGANQIVTQAANIQDGVITNAKIASLDATKITSGYIDAARINAGSITASKLNVTVGGLNRLANSAARTATPVGWANYFEGAVTRDTAVKPAGENASIRVDVSQVMIDDAHGYHGATVGTTEANGSKSMEAGVSCVSSAWVFCTTSKTIRIAGRATSAAGAYLGSGAAVDTVIPANIWTRIDTLPWTYAPADFIPMIDITWPDANGAGTFYVSRWQSEAGDIPTGWSPMADEILPGTITANSLSADAIDGKTITGATIQTSAATNPRFTITPTGFTATDGSGATVLSYSGGALSLKGSITVGSTVPGSTVNSAIPETSVPSGITGTKVSGALSNATLAGDDLTNVGGIPTPGGLSDIESNLGTITAGTITGATLQTSSVGTDRRVVINSNGLTAYATGGVTKVLEYKTSDGTLNLTGTLNVGSNVPGPVITNVAGIPTPGGLSDISSSLGTINAGTINGATITGGTLQTSSSGTVRRVVMDSAGLTAYGTGGVTKILEYKTSDGTLNLTGTLNVGSNVPGGVITAVNNIPTPGGLSDIESDLGSITAGSMSAVTITGGILQTSASGTVRRVVIDSNGLSAYTTGGVTKVLEFKTSDGTLNLTGTLNVGSNVPGQVLTNVAGIPTPGGLSDIEDNLGTINAGAINGATITGGILQTSSSGTARRVVIDSNGLTAYATGGVTKVLEYKTSDGTLNLTGSLNVGSNVPGGVISAVGNIPTPGGLSDIESNLGTITAGAMSAVTITGGTLQTSSLGTDRRVVINSAGLTAYATGGVTKVLEYKTSDGTLNLTGSLNVGSNVPGGVITAVTNIPTPGGLSDIDPNIGLITAGTIRAATIETVAPGTNPRFAITSAGFTATDGSGATILSYAGGVLSLKGSLTVGSSIPQSVIPAGIDASKLSISVGGGNQAVNSSFENSALPNLGAWQCTLTSVTTQKFHGIRALRMTGTASGDMQVIDDTNRIAVRTGDKITYSAWVRPATSAKTCWIGPRKFASGAFTAQGGTSIVCPGNVWTRISHTETVTTEDEHGWVVTATGVSTSSIVDVDAVQVERGDVMTAYGPKEDEILPGTIQADMIKADAIDGKTITGATFQTSASNPAVRMTSGGIESVDALGVPFFSLPSGGSPLFKGSVVADGGLVLDSDAAAPVLANNKISWQDAAAGETAALYATEDGFSGQTAGGALRSVAAQAQSYKDLILSSARSAKLTRYWRPEGGNTITDHKGTLHLTNRVYSGTWLMNGVAGLAAAGDGSMRLATYSNLSYHSWQQTSTDTTASNRLSVEFWITVNSIGAVQNIINKTNWEVLVHADGTVRFGLSTSASYKTLMSTALTPGVMYHMVATWDGTNMVWYKNGVQDTSTTHTGTLVSQATYPYYVLGSIGPADITLDELAVYMGTSALTAAEVLEDYNAGITGVGPGVVERSRIIIDSAANSDFKQNVDPVCKGIRSAAQTVANGASVSITWGSDTDIRNEGLTAQHTNGTSQFFCRKAGLYRVGYFARATSAAGFGIAYHLRHINSAGTVFTSITPLNSAIQQPAVSGLYRFAVGESMDLRITNAATAGSEGVAATPAGEGNSYMWWEWVAP